MGTTRPNSAVFPASPPTSHRDKVARRGKQRPRSAQLGPWQPLLTPSPMPFDAASVCLSQHRCWGQGLWSFLQLRRGLAGRGQRAPADPPLWHFSLQVTDLGLGMQQVLSVFAIMVDFLQFDFSPTLLSTHFTREKAEVQRGKDCRGHAARRCWQD